MHKHFVELVCDPLSCKTLSPRQVWEELDQSMPYEGSIHCDIPPWPVSVRVLVSLALTALNTIAFHSPLVLQESALSFSQIHKFMRLL